ncbi:hypothetical protein QVD17_31251 [Tagetes erecta]|uniref:25S rRNA (uridine-N(3))-methyltransferase BMT5-like domain-containing protein n=1 Tax=Tagetes erecta TaxID=13708 RepID=A0AAD8K474_TARER|nr:hypothetical protein QVD17_31251 [Tagetes erecta]
MAMNETKWAKHYSSDHEILLVGEGDFSFSVSLANVFGSASNIVATSFDSKVDAMTMKHHPDLRNRKFDRIVYNFPHAGFCGDERNLRVINKHRNLVGGFFENSSHMLRPRGEVHVSHKTTGPFVTWNIEDLASRSSLALVECVGFNISDYPGYQNKRGDGSRSNEPFHLGKCSTFKFILSKKSNCSRQQPHEISSVRGNAGNMISNRRITYYGDSFLEICRWYDDL